jgi:hypothetical protein
LVPVPALLILYSVVRRRDLLRSFVVSAVVGYGIMGLWTLRNYNVSGEFVPVAVGPGFSMLSGHFMIDESRNADLSVQVGEKRALALMSDKLGRRLTRASLKTAGHWDIPKEIDRAFSQTAWSMVREDPSLLVRKTAINMSRFWYFSSSRTKCAINLIVNYSVLILSVPAFTHAYRKRRTEVEILLLGVVFLMLIYSLVNVSSSRYCLPAIVLFPPFAVWTLTSWYSARRQTDG